ncbi:hypothetical protein [Microbacterium sp. SA39]|uniref:hypothetical protein n=1 Tax=Microbacterium sp. SA39 TaxID=1263625 RepID=UPI00061EF8C9|nr:hypothetical protein [Microbacterium sp. SA39]KJQ55756.1 hypothetical protein RS85_00459 [Microbacterium sp. SA39]
MTASVAEPGTRRICQDTGLALVAGPVSSFRIARESYGALAPKPRESGDDPGSWSRYDTIGRTIYSSADRVTAFMELLASYRTDINAERRALQPAADAVGMSLDDYWNDIVSEWDEAGNMKAMWLPRAFRDGRALYTLEYPDGWWIDASATETIAAIHDLFTGPWPTKDGDSEKPLTLADLPGDDRVLTTAIAGVIREHVQLDDGTLPLGIQFLSKHGRPTEGSGLCWAYWMRQVDSGLDEPAKVLATEPIRDDDAAYKAAQVHCKIKSR